MQLGRSFFFSLLQFCERMIAADVRFESLALVWNNNVQELEKISSDFICVSKEQNFIFCFVLFCLSLVYHFDL